MKHQVSAAQGDPQRNILPPFCEQNLGHAGASGDLSAGRVGVNPSAHNPIGRVTDNSVLRLHAFVLQERSQNGYIAIRIGCRTLTSVATSRVGATAIRLLNRRSSIRSVREHIARSNGQTADQVDLVPLIRALLRARMVKSIDGRTVDSDPSSVLRASLLRFQFALRRLVGQALRQGYLVLPSVAHWINIRSKLMKRDRHTQKKALALDNISACMGDSLSSEACEEIAGNFVVERIRSDADSEMLINPTRRTLHWLFTRSVIHGESNYIEATREGRGVALCGLHFCSTYLLLPILWLHGFSFVGAGASPRFDLESVIDFTNRFGNVSGKAGSVMWHTKVSFRGALAIVHALRGGKTALIFGDGFIARSSQRVACELGHSVIGFNPGLACIDFLGQQFYANTATSWFAAQFDGPIVPVRLVRRRGRFHVYIERPLRRNGDITEQLYRRLERDVYLDPAGWSYWDKVANMRSDAVAQ